MDSIEELRAGLVSIAQRSLQIRPACKNEESAKLYLVLPVLGLLGYDYTNPLEVYPEHVLELTDGKEARVDFAILRDGRPIMAIEAKKVGADLSQEQDQIRRYYNANEWTRLGVLSNGIRFDFFVDSYEPDVMDADPFLTLDLEMIAQQGVQDEVLESLIRTTKKNFAPGLIAEAAHVQLVKKRLRAIFAEELSAPSEDFCRFMLGKIGLPNARRDAIERNYGPLTKAAFDEALIMPIVEQLRAHPTMPDGTSVLASLPLTPQLVTADRELAIFAYCRRRLAFLVNEQHLFEAIEQIRYKEFVGRIAVFFGREDTGRLFDFIAGQDGRDKFSFPAPFGDIVTAELSAIDGALLSTFTSRARELGGTASASQSFAKTG